MRRDLEKMTKLDPTIVRVHGGAYKTGVFDSEMPVQLRETLSVERKKTIADNCVPFLRVNDTVMLDCSTTALYLAMAIRQLGCSLTVITNSIRVIEVLQDCEQMKLIMIGGDFRHTTQSFVGYEATNMLSHFRADRCFISCTGIHMEFGITDNSENEVQVRQMMMRNSRERFLLVDAFKFGRSFLSQLAEPSEFDTVITDAVPSPEWLTYFQSNHTRLIY